MKKVKIVNLCFILISLSACGSGEYEKAEMILSDIPDDYERLMPDREIGFVLNGVRYTLPCKCRIF